MAEGDDDTERTEEPTPKRLEEAIQRGDVVRSQEVNTWFVLSAGALVLMIFGPGVAKDLAVSFRGILSNAGTMPADGGALTHFVAKMAAGDGGGGRPAAACSWRWPASPPTWSSTGCCGPPSRSRPKLVQDLADQRIEAPVRQGGAGPVPQGAGQDRHRRQRALRHPVAAARAAGGGAGLRRRRRCSACRWRCRSSCSSASSR